VIVITIPAHNEAKTIEPVIRSIHKVMSHKSYAIIVVADNCTDNTATIARGARALVYEKNTEKGLAGTFRMEMQKALLMKPSIIVHIDADGQYLAAEIPKLLSQVEQGYDLVLGSRLTGYIEHMSFTKKFFNRLAARIFSRLVKQRVDDVTTGFRAFVPAVARLPVKSNFTYTQEQIVRASKAGYKIKNVPVSFLARQDESRLIKHSADYITRSLRELWKLNREVKLIG
jgi:glycosyltransferase involved in cell wall biosynthesis